MFDDTAKWPTDSQVLGRCLGPATGVGKKMCQWVLQANGEIVSRRTVRPLLPEELHQEVEQKKRDLFDVLIEMRHGGSIPKRMCTSSLVEEEEDWVQYSSEEELVKEVPDMEDDVDFCGRVLNQQPLYDKMLNLEIELENGYI